MPEGEIVSGEGGEVIDEAEEELGRAMEFIFVMVCLLFF